MINNKKILIAVTILTLVAFNVVQFLINRRAESLAREKYESKQLELVTTYAKLDTISTQLDEKIFHIRSLGGSVDSLLEIKNQLEQDKYALKQANHLAKGRYEKIKKKVSGYEQLLLLKDEEIARFENVNKELVSERIALIEKTDVLTNEVSRLEEEKDKLLEQMSKAATLAIKNIRFFSVNRTGALIENREFKNNSLNKLLITVKLSKNQLAKKGKKLIAMRIIEPEGASLYNATSGTFKYKGKEMFSTASSEFYFDNKEEEVDFTFVKGNDYMKGNHRVEFYCEGQRIGQGDFIIR
ncbi:MAG: chromosome segregation protein SMC [Flammeovirgaceae bacterium]